MSVLNQQTLELLDRLYNQDYIDLIDSCSLIHASGYQIKDLIKLVDDKYKKFIYDNYIKPLE